MKINFGHDNAPESQLSPSMVNTSQTANILREGYLQQQG
jgi:hypothetical protein